MNELLIILATYGVATLMTDYDGPYGAFKSLQDKYAVFQCNVCLGVYILLPMYILAVNGLILPFSILGGFLIIARNL